MLFLSYNVSFAKDKYVGKGQAQFDDIDIDYFVEGYLNHPAGQSPSVFWIAVENGKTIWSMYWYCPNSSCGNTWSSHSMNKKKCEKEGVKFYKTKMNTKKDIECFCEFVGIATSEFFKIIEPFRNLDIWKFKSNRWEISDFLIEDWEW